MNVLIGCEESGKTRDAFIAKGHNAWSCDLKPGGGIHADFHLQCDIRDVLHLEWGLLIVHPDCTYLCSSGLHWNKRVPGRQAKTDEALSFVQMLLDLPIPKIALENPVGCIGTRIRKADQYIQPHEFGHDASKRTGLWLKNLPKLRPTHPVAPRVVNGKMRWGNQTDSGQNKLAPSENRAAERAETYQGWSNAMADQWGA